MCIQDACRSSPLSGRRVTDHPCEAKASSSPRAPPRNESCLQSWQWAEMPARAPEVHYRRKQNTVGSPLRKNVLSMLLGVEILLTCLFPVIVCLTTVHI